MSVLVSPLSGLLVTETGFLLFAVVLTVSFFKYMFGELFFAFRGRGSRI